MGIIAIVPCPHCKKILFRTEDHGNGLSTRLEREPPIDNDAQGDFMICPHADCRKRISFDRWKNALGWAFVVSPDQEDH